MTPLFLPAVCRRLFFVSFLLALSYPALAQRQMERLGRGVVVLHTSSAQAYVGWRLLATDPADVGFNLYRSANGAPGIKLNSLPLTNTTDYVDSGANFTLSNAWYIIPVTNGVEGAASAPYGLAANPPIRQYVSLPLQPVTGGLNPPYDVKFCWVGDFDGDGEYDYLVDRQSLTGSVNQYLQAYKRDGTLLWQMDMGYNSTNQYNIEPGASAISVGDKDNVTVYDLDGDGKAEVCVRIARGVKMPDGSTVTGPDDVTQYFSILNGLTGAELARTTITNLWPGDGPLNSHFGIMYCDGVRPSLLIRGENRNAAQNFQRETMTYDYRNGQLTRRWFHTPANGANESWGHQIRIMDVNHDGCDDLIDVGSALNGATGQPLFDTELVHGDRFHITDIDPDRPGLEMFSIQQLNPTLLATAFIDMTSGKLIKKWYSPTITDVGRGIALDLDPNHRGLEFYSTQPGIFDCKGNQIFANNVWPPEALWWDADLSREFEDGAGNGALNPVVNKFNPTTGNTDRIYTLYNEGGGNHQAYGGRAAFWGDILGDWREEFVVVADDYSSLYIYSTKLSATNRLYCLMQNPAYRCQSTCKGYYQASYVDYFLANQMPPPPTPSVSDAKLVWHGNSANIWDANTTANWFTNWIYVGNANTNPASFNAGDTVLFDQTGSNHTAITLNGSVQPGDVRIHSPTNFTFDSTAGSIDGPTKLTKGGAGNVTLNGTNNYTGATLVSEGLFIVNGLLPNSPVTVRGGVWLDGRLGGTGIIGSPVVINEGAGVSPGQGMNSPGTLTITNNVSLNGRTLSDFDLSDDASGNTKTNDLLIINGNLTLKGTNTFVIHQLNPTLPPGVYPLVNYSGFLTGSLANLTVSGLTGIPIVLSNSPGQIALVVKNYRAPATISWTGGSGGNAWDLLISSNWFNGAVKDQFAPFDTVRFDDTGKSNLTVNLSGDLNCSGVVVDSTTNYTLTGSGGIIGPASLTKTNSGTLVLSTLNNSFTGKTILAGGTLVVSELDAVGFPSPLGNPPAGSTNLIMSGSPTLRITGESYTDRGLTINAGTNTLDITNSSDQLTVAGIITGSGALQKAGAGTLALSVKNTYTGPTFIRGGNVSLGGGTVNQYGLGVGPGGNGNTTITLDNGTLTMYSDSGSYDTCYWNLIVSTNSTGTIYGDDRCNLYGSLTGGGTLNFNVYYVRCELDGNWSAFTGQLNLGTDSGGGDFRIGTTAGYGNASVNLADHIYAYHVSGNSVAFGSLSGGTYANMSGTPWTIGAKNIDSTYAGSIVGNSLTKVGIGTLTLTGNTNTYTGTTTINGGTLQIGNGGTSGSIGTGAITDNATLAFNQSDAITDTNFSVITGAGGLAKRGTGSLALTKTHTFTGATTIEAGTLVLTNLGGIPNSSNVIVLKGATLDVSGTSSGIISGVMTLAGGKMISGSGAVKGNFAVGTGAYLSPGTNGIGTLSFSNNLILNGACTNFFDLSKSPFTNDSVKVLGTLANGGALIVTNISATAFAAGDTFKLFNAASYSGTFSKLILPPLPAGLGWNTNGINTNGTLAVVITAKPLVGAVAASGSGLAFHGTGGVANGDYYLIGTTNMATPVSSWQRLRTNQFDNNGNFDFTNPPNPNWPQGYYQLLVP